MEIRCILRFFNRHRKTPQLSCKRSFRIPRWRHPSGCAVPSASHLEVNYFALFSVSPLFKHSPFYKVQCIYCLDVFELLLFCSGLLSWPGRACHHHSHRENCSLQPKTWTAFTNSNIQGVKLKKYSANCIHFWVVLCLCCKFRVMRTSPLLPNRFCYALNIDQVTECNGLNVKLVVLRIISAKYTWKNSCVLHKVSPLLGTPCRCII